MLVFLQEAIRCNWSKNGHYGSQWAQRNMWNRVRPKMKTVKESRHSVGKGHRRPPLIMQASATLLYIAARYRIFLSRSRVPILPPFVVPRFCLAPSCTLSLCLQLLSTSLLYLIPVVILSYYSYYLQRKLKSVHESCFMSVQKPLSHCVRGPMALPTAAISLLPSMVLTMFWSSASTQRR